MGTRKHLDVLSLGVSPWNEWRRENIGIVPDLSGADLNGANLSMADLSGANLINAKLNEAELSRANLRRANVFRADLSKANLNWARLGEVILTGASMSRASLFMADLSGANLIEANLGRADLSGANLSGADLNGANLFMADLSGTNLFKADLSGANIERASLVDTNLEEAKLTACRTYGISAWNLNLFKAQQENLVITPLDEATITVDSLEVGQFIYLLLNNGRIRSVIDAITSKVVLILGRFTPERKAVLDAIREELRKRNYLPVLFDFDKPTSRNLTETVSTLAHMARFVIADITDVRSIPQELMATIPHLPSVPVQPLLLASDKEYAMFPDFQAYPWVLEPFTYDDRDMLLASLKTIVNQVEIKVTEQTAGKARKRARQRRPAKNASG